jgi:hypothetical protein
MRFYVSWISETTAYLVAKERWKFNMLFSEKQEAHFIPGLKSGVFARPHIKRRGDSTEPC